MPRARALESSGHQTTRISSGLKSEVGPAHLVVDAILGTGRARPISGVLESILKSISDVRAAKSDSCLLAVDLSTGLNCDTGEVDPACVAPDITVALGYPKYGHVGFPGARFTGRLEVADIGLPSGLDGDVRLELMTSDYARSALPRASSRLAQRHFRQGDDCRWIEELPRSGVPCGSGGRQGRSRTGHDCFT